ncbi:MAG TPA: hypothetical protein VKY86_09645 [Promicromonospora sp.]|nr:hypothetical protein [Promicromonospora sp.]
MRDLPARRLPGRTRTLTGVTAAVAALALAAGPASAAATASPRRRYPSRGALEREVRPLMALEEFSAGWGS